jgi:hypothetical protein
MIETSMYNQPLVTPALTGPMDMEIKKQNMLGLQQQNQLRGQAIQQGVDEQQQKQALQQERASYIKKRQEAGSDIDKQIGVAVAHGDAKAADELVKLKKMTQDMDDVSVTHAHESAKIYHTLAAQALEIQDPVQRAKFYSDGLGAVMQANIPNSTDTQQSAALKLAALGEMIKTRKQLDEGGFTQETLDSHLQQNKLKTLSAADIFALDKERRAQAIKSGNPLSDIGKILADAGIDPNSAEGKAAIQGHIKKTNYIAPPSSVTINNAKYNGADPEAPLTKSDEMAAIRMAESGQRETPSSRNPGALVRNARADVLQANPEQLQKVKEQHNVASGTNAAIVKAAVAGDAKALSSLTNQYHALVGLESTAKKNAELLIPIFKKLKDSGSPFLNQKIRDIDFQSGGVEINQARIVLEGLKAEYSRINSGNVLNVVHADVQEHMDKILRGDLTLAQMEGTLKILQKEGHNRTNSIKERIEDIKKQGKPQQETQSKPPTKVNPSDGKTYYLHSDGKYYSEKG